MASSGEVRPGSYFLHKKRGDCVRKVESFLPDGVKVRVRHYWVGHPPQQMWDCIRGYYLAGTWGRPISEAEARRLVPDMDERDARLDAEREPYWQEIEQDVWREATVRVVRLRTQQLASAVTQLRDALDALCRATETVRAAGVAKARRAALDVLSATASVVSSEETEKD